MTILSLPKLIPITSQLDVNEATDKYNSYMEFLIDKCAPLK